MIYEELICFCGLTFLIPQRQKRKSHIKTVSINVSKTLGLLCLTLYRLHIKEIYDVKWSAKTCVCLKSVTSKQKQDTQKLNWVHSRMLLVSRWIELQKIKNKILAFDKMNGKMWMEATKITFFWYLIPYFEHLFWHQVSLFYLFYLVSI